MGSASDSWLALATTLDERIAALRCGAARPLGDPGRLRAFRRSAHLDDERDFATWLAERHLDADELCALLTTPPSCSGSAGASTPRWLTTATEALEEFRGPSLRFADDVTGPLPRFLHLAEPFIGWGLAELRRALGAFAGVDLPWDPATIERVLFASLPDRLFASINRCLVLELNVARLEGRLRGDDARARFLHFTRQLEEPITRQGILRDYPVLARQLAVAVAQWVDTSLELLRRLRDDHRSIADELLGGGELGLLASLDVTGDQHDSGRAVTILHFAGGARVVYRPKSLCVDVHFQELLAWLNERGDHPPFRTLRVIQRGAYGWVEFVDARACATAEEVERFYVRQGGYLALLHALRATDFHFENVIAAGEHPVLVDLESLFHPESFRGEVPLLGASGARLMATSVLRVGFLPNRMWDRAFDSVEMSALGADPGQLTAASADGFNDEATDRMHVGKQRISLASGQNRPSLRGRDVDVLEHVEPFVRGFEAVYELLRAHRSQLVGPAGFLARFATDETRVIVRQTRVYGALLRNGYHPDVLRDACDRDALFDGLRVGARQQPHLAPLVPAERRALWRDDIPLFRSRPGSRDLLGPDGEVFRDHLERSALESAESTLASFGPEDRTRQVWLARASMAVLAMETGHPFWHSYEPAEVAPRHPDAFLEAACAVGDRLATLSIREGDEARWVGVSLVRDAHWALTVLGDDLYEGLAGIAFFLAYLGALSGRAGPTDLARAAIRVVRRRIAGAAGGAPTTGVGGFAGAGGIVYVLTHLGALWGEPALYDEAEALAWSLADRVEGDTQYDVVGGSAGLVGSLLCLHASRPSAATLELALRAARHLVASAKGVGNGLGWSEPGSTAPPLTGFSHGAAGIAWALLRLAAMTGDRPLRATAESAIAYERSTFSEAERGWPDLRVIEGGDPAPRFMDAWCHGAPGIGLARLATLGLLDDERTRGEIEVALSRTRRHGFGMNHSLCHGDFGNVELFLSAASALGDDRLRAEANRLGAAFLESFASHGYLSGVPLGVETPGLLTGIAGIGYGLLRLARPDQTPNVLVLAEPPTRR